MTSLVGQLTRCRLAGPWMSMWEITHSNRHTQAHNAEMYDDAVWTTRTLENSTESEKERNTRDGV